MRTAAIALAAALLVVACGSSDASGPSGPPTPPPTSSAPSTPAPAETPTPSPSGEGFCVDRAVIGDVYRLVRTGAVPFREAAAAVTAAGKVMRADVASAPTDRAARKIRQFVLVLNTLRLAILGAAENYPGDFSVRQYTSNLLDRVADISGALDCPA